jgi:hypothetical protein
MPVAGAILLDRLDQHGDPIGDPVGFPIISDEGEGELVLGTGLARWSPNNPVLHSYRVTYKAEEGEDSLDAAARHPQG